MPNCDVELADEPEDSFPVILKCRAHQVSASMKAHSVAAATRSSLSHISRADWGRLDGCFSRQDMINSSRL